jgi:hypothetical protein
MPSSIFRRLEAGNLKPSFLRCPLRGRKRSWSAMDGCALGQRHNEENSSPSDLPGAFYDKSITYTKAQSLTRRRNDLRRIADFQIANRQSQIDNQVIRLSAACRSRHHAAACCRRRRRGRTSDVLKVPWDSLTCSHSARSSSAPRRILPDAHFRLRLIHR